LNSAFIFSSTLSGSTTGPLRFVLTIGRLVLSTTSIASPSTRRFRIVVFDVCVTVLNGSTNCVSSGVEVAEAKRWVTLMEVSMPSATESVSRSNLGYGGLRDVFVVQERGENAREEGMVAVVHDRALAESIRWGQWENMGSEFGERTCRYASEETLGVTSTRWMVPVNGKMAMVTLCSFPLPGMLHLPSMMYETDATSFVIRTILLGWYGYCGSSGEVALRCRLWRTGLWLLITVIPILLRSGESCLVRL